MMMALARALALRPPVAASAAPALFLRYSCSLQLPKAINRLELMRIPATDQHFSATSVSAEPMLCVETTGVLITTVDMVKLNQVEVDQLAPCVSACLESLNKHTWLKDFDPKTKLQEW